MYKGSPTTLTPIRHSRRSSSDFKRNRSISRSYSQTGTNSPKKGLKRHLSPSSAIKVALMDGLIIQVDPNSSVDETQNNSGVITPSESKSNDSRYKWLFYIYCITLLIQWCQVFKSITAQITYTRAATSAIIITDVINITITGMVLFGHQHAELKHLIQSDLDICNFLQM
jgi:hypothetical protein